MGIERENLSVLEYGGHINLTKGALETGDIVNTISPTYAREMLDPAFSFELNDFLQKKRHKIHGICNGIDISEYNPLTDPQIATNYGADDAREGKALCKKALRAEFGMKSSAAPLIGVVAPFRRGRGLDLLLAAADALLDSGFQLVVAGSGDDKYEKFFSDLARRRPDAVGARIGSLREWERKIYSGSDIFLMPSKTEPCGYEQMAALRYGAAPVVRATGGLADTVRDSDEDLGNGFAFTAYDARDMLKACRRAWDAYRDEARWDALVRRAMRCDNSWATAAEKYMELYRKAWNSTRLWRNRPAHSQQRLV
jgi:starch synthase